MNVSHIILIGIVIAGAITATLVLAKVVEAVSNATSRVERVPATIAMKREDRDSRFVVTFDLDDETLTLNVPRDIYDSVAKGSRGTLEHKGTRFIGFDPL